MASQVDTAEAPYRAGSPNGASAPCGAAPQRRPGSIRRTSTVDVDFPEGRVEGAMRARGRARDLFTPADGGAPRVLAEDSMEITGTAARQVTAIRTSRSDEAAQGLVGALPGGQMRKRLSELLPQEQALSTPLHLLLDDYTGASLVSGWSWSQWPQWKAWMASRAERQGSHRPPADICSGWRTGGHVWSREDPTDPHVQTVTRNTPSLRRADDPIGWHEFVEPTSTSLKRARRLDLWFEDGVVKLDLGFQDSGAMPAGGRTTVHEYQVSATADPQTFALLSVETVAGALPHGECLLAIPSPELMIGTPLADFRREVLSRLRGVVGCTHLNDVLRCMADAPALAARLQAELAT